MPSELRPDAQCPKCNEPLEAAVWHSGPNGRSVELFHSRGSSKARRKRRCVMNLTESEEKSLRDRLHVDSANATSPESVTTAEESANAKGGMGAN
jgi:hypothetical protein